MKRSIPPLTAILTAVLFAGLAATFSVPGVGGPLAAEAQTQTVARSGTLDLIWGDPRPGSGRKPTLDYVLTDGRGRTTELLLDEGDVRERDGPQALDGERVEVEGRRVPENSSGFAVADERVEVSSLQQASYGGFEATTANAAAVGGSQPAVTILCRFGDSTGVTPHAPGWFETLMGSTAPGMDHYWRQASYGNMNLTGSNVVGWYDLPQPLSYYEGDFQRLFDGCTGMADGEVDFSKYSTINLMFNQDSLGSSLGGRQGATLDGKRGFGVTLLPPWGYEMQGVVAHEMGHTYGLRHSGHSTPYDSNWDVMSFTGKCVSPHPVYGCLGMHPISYHKDSLGWIPPERKYVASAGSTRTLTLERLGVPTATGGYLMAKIPIGTSTTQFYTVEARRFAGYDTNVPGEAVVIHKVDTSLSDMRAKVMDATDNGDPNDAGAMWLPGETFTDSANGISIGVTDATTSGYTVRVDNPGGEAPDTTVPTVSLTTPQDGDTLLGASVALSADATDDVGVSRVDFYVGSQKVGSDSSAPYSATWDSTTVADGSKPVTARAYDAANNEKVSAARSVVVDNLWPNSTITGGPPEGSFKRSTSASFSFTSTDPDGSFECQLDSGPVEVCSSGKGYSALSQGSHTFTVWAIGSAGKAADTEQQPSVRTWTVDTAKPTGRVKINNGASTTDSLTVTLKLSATDPAPASGVAKMRLSNGGTWGSWQAFSASKSWTLTSGAGAKTVWVQYRDRAGNLSAAAKDTITYSP